MQHVLIIHEVKAYPAWKVIFDGCCTYVQKRKGNQLPIIAL